VPPAHDDLVLCETARDPLRERDAESSQTIAIDGVDGRGDQSCLRFELRPQLVDEGVELACGGLVERFDV